MAHSNFYRYDIYDFFVQVLGFSVEYNIHSKKIKKLNELFI